VALFLSVLKVKAWLPPVKSSSREHIFRMVHKREKSINSHTGFLRYLLLASKGWLEAEVLPGQESFNISPLMTANCWLIADEEADELTAGSLVKIAPLYPGSFP
jgi:molybdopterin biosynthesis enzyme